MSITWACGRFVSWTGGCVFVGDSMASIPEHAHYAIQIAFGPRHGIRFRTNADWQEYGGAIIPSLQPHSMDSTGVGMGAVLLIEPETPQGRALTKRYLQRGIATVPEDILANYAPSIFKALGALDVPSALEVACKRLLQALTGDGERAVFIDERISHAIAFINTNLNKSLTLELVASEACLSPSRFRHVFVEETGMALRSYILWRRFVRIWELLSEGASLSTAAHAAGFADAAHLTRTSRTMFGFPPSALQMARLRSSPIESMTQTATRAGATPRLTQMGNHGHSSEGARLINEWIAAGVIGPVHEVHVWTNRPAGYWPQGVPRPGAGVTSSR